MQRFFEPSDCSPCHGLTRLRRKASVREASTRSLSRRGVLGDIGSLSGSKAVVAAWRRLRADKHEPHEDEDADKDSSSGESKLKRERLLLREGLAVDG